MAAPALSFIPKVSRLSGLVTRILGCNPSPMTLQGTNVYLLGRGPKRVLVDTADGHQPEFFENLRGVLEEDACVIEAVVLTHWHHDHVGGVQHILEQFGRPKVFKCRRRDDLEWPDLEYAFVEDGDLLNSVEGVTLTAVHTPGHTTDHIALRLHEEDALFSGDCVLGEGTAVFEDLKDYMDSLTKIRGLEPAVIYPAHGAVVEKPGEKIDFYLSHRNARESQIVSALESATPKSLSAMDIVKRVYGSETPESLYEAAAKNVRNHLSKLIKENRVEALEEDAFVIKRL